MCEICWIEKVPVENQMRITPLVRHDSGRYNLKWKFIDRYPFLKKKTELIMIQNIALMLCGCKVTYNI